MTTKLTRIKTALKLHIEEAEKLPPGLIVYPGVYDTSVEATQFPQGPVVGTANQSYMCDLALGEEDMAAFIAHARTMSPLACKGLLLSIERFEKIACFHDGHVVDGSFDEPGSAQEAREALQEIESLFPDEN